MNRIKQLRIRRLYLLATIILMAVGSTGAGPVGIYTGGSFDGYSKQQVTTVTIPLSPRDASYVGGAYDGYSKAAASVSLPVLRTGTRISFF